MLELVKPDLVVSDYAPGALIAAKALGVDTFSIGNGFTIPPAVRPSPVYFGQRQFAAEVLAQAEAPLISSINAALAAFSKVTVNSVSDLYPARDCALLTWPQLDHHVQRPGARYFAQEYAEVRSASPPWPASGNVKVFVYCHPHYRHLAPLMAGLKHSGASCIVVAPEIPEAIAATFSGPTIKVVSQLVNIQSMISTADIVVTNGHNTCAIALEQATPTIVLPMHTEQAIVGQRLASQNLGSVLAATPSQALTSGAIATEIEELAANDSVRHSIDAASAHINAIKSGSARTTVSDEILNRLT
ncbi:glycosyltransferase [Niveibacterium sp. COAC-50]|uniref:glycosyltransferase n=1 Tax=Niveibacterium sp. COAC-50 TaxID=2729384 RepID=UPI0015525ACB|nr:hypothetical protein [Niveibacterium sp. COAC-50]